VIRREVAGGPAAARNEGLQHVEGEFVAFLDSDCVPPEDWIERLGGHFDDPRVAAVAPRIRALDGGRSPLDMGPGRRVPYVPSAALIVRRSLASFDPALRYGEDVDLIWRLERRAGGSATSPTSSCCTRSATGSRGGSGTGRRRRRSSSATRTSSAT
jgi:glycosyltransferase involved in cell wall biosynthesis